MRQADVLIIGGGIIGLATGYQLVQRNPRLSIRVLEKEQEIAFHQTGRNSGVLHSGIYYRPGSLRAHNCREGKKAMEAFCEAEGVAYEVCGKVIVAVTEEEVPALERIYDRGQKNGVRCEMIDADRLHELEPHVSGVKAIHVPESGIVDYVSVCRRLADHIRKAEGEIVTGAEVEGLHSESTSVVARTTQGDFSAKYLVNCAGLHCDRVAKLAGARPSSQIIPFRGEYFELLPQAKHLCRNLIYPVPDPNFPFLGVHFTRMTDGSVECGPNAVLAFAREGYRRTDVNLRDLRESLSYPGFLRLAARHWRMGANEMWRSWSKAAFVRALQRLIPEIQSSDLEAAPSGVRAQAVSPDGKLVDDFVIQEQGRMIHVENAPSPAATAALNIGRLIVEKLAPQMEA